MIRVLVSAKPERGFWRAGRFWPSTPTEAEVSVEDLARLAAEPLLEVKVLEEEAVSTPLPDNLPHRDRLIAAGFDAVEKIPTTLQKFYGKSFKKEEAEAILAALKPQE